LCAISVRASTIPAGDPKIGQGGDPGSSPTPIISAAFYILSPSGTSPAPKSPCELFQSFSGGTPVMTGSSPDCLFQNLINPSGTGQNITQLVFDIGDVSSDVTCLLINTLDFKHCGVMFPEGGGTVATFNQGSIPYQSEFSLQLQGFPKNTQAGCSPISTCPPNATTSPIPEPGTVALFLGGIGALLIGRRLRARSLS
jgi:hypothetical protein